MKRTHWMQTALLGGSLALAAHGATAQETASPPPASGSGFNTTVFVGAGPLPVSPAQGQLNLLARIVGKVVTGKPYSADAVTERTQALADGNRIVTRSEARIYRDSSGRTRREQMLIRPVAVSPDGAPVATVSIDDPVAKVSYVLDPQTQTARELHPFAFEQQAAAPQDGSKGVVSFSLQRGNVFFQQRVPAPSSGEPPAPQAGVATAQSPSVGVAPPPAPPPGAAGPVLAYTVVSPGNAGAEPARTEDLGDEVIEGVLAHGTRVTHTIPVGAIGNELPIDVVSESWYSSELDEVVMSKFSDPRIGETTYRLENLVREEPAPDLFTVPSDYKLVAEDVPSPGAWADQNGSPGTRVERRVFIAPPNAASH